MYTYIHLHLSLYLYTHTHSLFIFIVRPRYGDSKRQGTELGASQPQRRLQRPQLGRRVDTVLYSDCRYIVYRYLCMYVDTYMHTCKDICAQIEIQIQIQKYIDIDIDR